MIHFSGAGRTWLASVALAAAAAAQAAPVVYYGYDPLAARTVPAGGNAITARNSFLGGLTSSVSDGFSNAPLGDVTTSLTVFGTSTLTQTKPANYTGASVRDGADPANDATGRFNTTPVTAGVNAYYFQTDASFTLNLASSVDAFGFYGTDLGDFDGTLLISLTNRSTGATRSDIFRDNSGNVPSTLNQQNGSLVFFGYADSQFLFDSITVSVVQGTGVTFNNRDFVGFDDLLIGRAVTGGGGNAPEPGSLALVATCLALLAGSRRFVRR